ncbi:MAG: HAD family phosphatase [Treponema sp.]|jgi:FMN phosphatase YigB (HAD superfamily)|nr:HAD family phosphatase [Treponema sp.]
MPILVSARLPSSTLRGIKAVIFDFDGTLYDYRLMPFRLIGLNPWDLFFIWSERRTRRAFAGRDYGSADAYYKAYFSWLGKLTLRSPGAMRAWYFDHYIPRMCRVLKKHYCLRPGVEEILNRLEAHSLLPGKKLKGVAVYSDYPDLRKRFNALGYDPGGKIRLFGPDSFGAQKPAPGPFRHIAGELGALPEETLVIGDRVDTDGKGALAAGMSFFRLDDGRRRYYRMDPDRAPPPKSDQAIESIRSGSGSWEAICAMLSVFFEDSP